MSPEARPAKRKISLRALDVMKARLAGLNLHTICAEALCPNISECFGQGQATFLILGRICTRNCNFCNVEHGRPLPPDPGEAGRVAEAVRRLGLQHVVITSSTRDDLTDGGAGMFVSTVEVLRRLEPPPTVETLIPDFGGNPSALRALAAAAPEMIGHNLETVRRLYPQLRLGAPRADYDRSLTVFSRLGEINPDLRLKSALMLGLGESGEEVLEAMEDLLRAGCRYLSIGQYLAPSRSHHPVIRRLAAGEFEDWRTRALAMGFNHVESGEFVRSSYRAAAYFERDREGGKRRSPF